MSSTENMTKKAKPHWKGRAKHLGDLLPDVLEDIVARRSGMNLDLIAAWPEIAGPDYAHCTRVEKINWPRKSDELDSFQPGILIVACDNAKAIYFQHETSLILERLNMFFGFEAISKIKLVQKPVNLPKRQIRQIPEKLEPQEEKRLEKMMAHITDPQLRKSLEKFGRGVIHSRKTAKSK